MFSQWPWGPASSVASRLHIRVLALRPKSQSTKVRWEKGQVARVWHWGARNWDRDEETEPLNPRIPKPEGDAWAYLGQESCQPMSLRWRHPVGCIIWTPGRWPGMDNNYFPVDPGKMEALGSCRSGREWGESSKSICTSLMLTCSNSDSDSKPWVMVPLC